MHHSEVGGFKKPAGMGGPHHRDHSPSTQICSHYPDQHLKSKNKDSESDEGDQGEGAGEGVWWAAGGDLKELIGDEMYGFPVGPNCV